MLEDNDRIVFVIYPAGSFGSFLSACLRMSPSAFNTLSNKDVFNEDGAAHNHIKEYMGHNFHSFEDLKYWVELPDEQKNEFVIKNWKPPVNFNSSNLFYIHRLIMPKKIHVFMNYFTKARFVKINVEQPEQGSICKMILKKIIPYSVKNSILEERFQEKVARRDLINQTNNDIIEGVYNFNVKWFLDGSFVKEFNSLCEYLNFEKVNTIEITNMYEEFKRQNNIC